MTADWLCEDCSWRHVLLDDSLEELERGEEQARIHLLFGHHPIRVDNEAGDGASEGR